MLTVNDLGQLSEEANQIAIFAQSLFQGCEDRYCALCTGLATVSIANDLPRC